VGMNFEDHREGASSALRRDNRQEGAMDRSSVRKACGCRNCESSAAFEAETGSGPDPLRGGVPFEHRHNFPILDAPSREDRVCPCYSLLP
jgi:hypothetical protein